MMPALPGGAGPLMSQMPMAAPGAMSSAQASAGAGNAASVQGYMQNAQAQHQAAQQQSLANTQGVASKFGIGQSSGPRGQGIVPAAGRFGVQRMPMPAGGGLSGVLSDEKSKKKIAELQSVNEHYRSLLGGPSSTEGTLNDAYREPTSNTYEYKDPSAQGAAPGRQSGPMADELKGIPGVVQPGPDGFDRVDPARLTMANTSQLAEQRRQLDEMQAHLDALGGKAIRPDDEAYPLDENPYGGPSSPGLQTEGMTVTPRERAALGYSMPGRQLDPNPYR